MSREEMNFASQKAVVLVVDKYSQDVHLASLTAGVKYPVKYISQEGESPTPKNSTAFSLI